MFTRPEGLHDEDVVRGLGAGWDLVGAQVEYAPLGFGSYHWRVRRGGHRWFATADDLAARRWDAAEPLPLVARRLTSALAGSRRLRDAGLEFVVAPLPQPSGELVRALGDRYVLALYPFVDGVTPQDGAYPDRTARAAVVARLAALHAVALPAVDPGDGSGVLADDFVLPHLAGLRTAMADPGGPWDGGPFAEPTRDLLARHAAPLAHALERYRRLVASVVARGTGFVLTHGEPHPGNTIGTPAGLVLIDWDTLLLAPPERDLWGLVEEDPDVLELYRSLTGRQADAEALRLYRLRWDLTEICLYVDQFRHAHRLSDDTAEAWAGLQHHLDPVRW